MATADETPDRDKWLTRIRALLAKAEDAAATPQEAETYTAKATELIARFGIDEALLAAQDPENIRPGDRVIPIDGAFARDKAIFLGTLAMALGCQAVRNQRWRQGANRYEVHLFGFESDLDRTEILWTSLLVQMSRGLAKLQIPWGEHAAAYRRSWIDGYRIAIYRRLKAAEDRAKANAETRTAGTDGPSTALVLRDRASLVEAAMYEAYPKLGKASKRELSGRGQHAGYMEGQRADLGGTRINQTTTRKALS